MAVCSDRCHSSYVMSLWYVCIRRGVSQRLMHFFIHTWRTDDSAITRACVTAVIVSLAVARCSRTTLSHAICSRLNHILSRNCLRSHASEVHVACVWPCDVRPRFFLSTVNVAEMAVDEDLRIVQLDEEDTESAVSEEG